MTPGYEEATHLLTEADVALTKSDFAVAMTRLDKALAALGSAYRSDNQIDDTGMKLAMAHGEASQGHLELAARLKRSVLVARLAICKPP